MAGQIESGKAFKLTVLTAAVSAGTMGAAGAVTISKAPVGFVPVVFNINVSGNQSFDTDGNGTPDFTIGSGGGGIIFSGTNPSSAYSGLVSVNGYSTPDSFVPVTSLKGNSASTDYIVSVGLSGGSSQFSPNVPMYAELATNVTYNGTTITGGTIGYLLGTRSVLSGAGTSSEIDSFTLSDFGVIGSATAVPEPSSLALLAMGGAGIATLRRRRQARPAA